MKYICNICGFVYDEDIGCPEEEMRRAQRGRIFPTILSVLSAESAKTNLTWKPSDGGSVYDSQGYSLHWGKRS